MNTHLKRWLTIEELEDEYCIKRNEQAKMRMEDNPIQIPFSKLGRKFIRYDRLKIDKWLEDHDVVRSER